MLKGRYEMLKGYENNHVTIGFGSYGQVKLAKQVDSGEIVAVKIVNKVAKNEVKMHNKLNHPNIIQLLSCQIDIEREITYMILEYADGGTLFQKIKMAELSKADIKRYFKQVCEAVAYLHSQSIMHRDIKPQNILLTKKNEAKLCDFGFAAILGERKTLCGTYEYMSPQMIQNRPYDYKIDIWALGILLFELIAGHAPFRGDKPEEVLQEMKTKIYFCERFQQEEINLIKTILRVTPQKRPTVEQILANQYFSIQREDEESILEKEMASLSVSTQESKIKMAPINFSESCNPKAMGEFQKTIQKQSQKQQQNSYPFYVPKTNQNKLGLGTTVVMPESTYQNTQKYVKAHSPHHYKGTTGVSTANTSLTGQMNFNQANRIPQPPQIQSEPNINPHINHVQTNPNLSMSKNIGFGGRFS